MIVSKITLYACGHRHRRWAVKIEHDGRIARSGIHGNSADAYADAESQLTYKPGYVQSIPKEDR